MTGMHGKDADPLPLGPPHLQWSFNKDGEDTPGMVAARDKRFEFNTADERQDRQDLVALAKPQGGVDAMAAHFPNAKPVPGVTDNGDATTRPVPTVGMKDGRPSRQGSNANGQASRILACASWQTRSSRHNARKSPR
jgi:hypothetical protein